MFSKKNDKEIYERLPAQISRLKENWKKGRCRYHRGRCRSFRPLPDSRIPGSGLPDTFPILLLNMAFPICTLAAFIHLKL